MSLRKGMLVALQASGHDADTRWYSLHVAGLYIRQWDTGVSRHGVRSGMWIPSAKLRQAPEALIHWGDSRDVKGSQQEILLRDGGSLARSCSSGVIYSKLELWSASAT